MASRTVLSAAYHLPLRDGILLVFMFSFPGAITLDMGEAAAITEGTLITYGLLLLMILIRRPLRPTRGDLWMVRLGFPILYFVGVLVYPWTWHLRGVR